MPATFPSPWEASPPLLPHGAAEAVERHVGLGDPLVGTSWLNRPYYAGWMVGEMFGDHLTSEVHQQRTLIGGYRLGWDFDHYWGIEGRWAFAYSDIHEPQAPSFEGTIRDRFLDANLLYYPWGDSRWRPYFSLGAGISTFDFRDSQGATHDDSLLSIPIGTGVKYYWKHWLTLRFSAIDNFSIGRGSVDTMHNLSLTGDMEVRWGGKRTSYFPHTGSLHLW